MAIIQLPHQDKLDRSSGPKSEGFTVNEVSYSSKVSQRSFAGADAESSREEVWTVKWVHLEYYTPNAVYSGKSSTVDEIRDFYKSAQLNKIEWRPFEINQNRIWSVVPNTLKITNPAGNLFEASMDLRYLYNIGDPISVLKFTQQPIAQTVDEYGIATFTVGVTGGSSPYTYVWKKDGVVI